MSVELLLRLLDYPKVFVINKDDSDYIEYDKKLDYKYLPNLNITIQNENYNVNIRTNSFGHRDKEWSLTNYDTTILVLGDSYSVGYGVEENQRWSNQLDSLLNNETKKYLVYNAAVSGYNLKQMTKAGYYLLPCINPEFVIIGIFLVGLDRIIDPYVYHAGFCVRNSKVKYSEFKSDQIIITHFQNRKLQVVESFIIEHSVFYNFLISRLGVLKSFFRDAQQESDLTLYQVDDIILSFKPYLDKEKVKLIILPVLQHEKRGGFSNKNIDLYKDLKIFCEHNKIIFVDILPSMQEELVWKNFWINNDKHWNKDAHQIAARLIYAIMKEN